MSGVSTFASAERERERGSGDDDPPGSHARIIASSCGSANTDASRAPLSGIAGWGRLVSEPIVIAPAGEIDFAGIAGFRAALADAARGEAHRLVVDLTDVTFIDSTGLGALIELQAHLRREKRELAVVTPGGTAAAVLLELAGLRGRLPIFETREAASET